MLALHLVLGQRSSQVIYEPGCAIENNGKPEPLRKSWILHGVSLLSRLQHTLKTAGKLSEALPHIAAPQTPPVLKEAEGDPKGAPGAIHDAASPCQGPQVYPSAVKCMIF